MSGETQYAGARGGAEDRGGQDIYDALRCWRDGANSPGCGRPRSLVGLRGVAQVALPRRNLPAWPRLRQRHMWRAAEAGRRRGVGPETSTVLKPLVNLALACSSDSDGTTMHSPPSTQLADTAPLSARGPWRPVCAGHAVGGTRRGDRVVGRELERVDHTKHLPSRATS